MPRRRSLGTLWLGEFPLGRRTILVHAEQGLGDTIQFVRYAPLLARSGAKVVLEVPPAAEDHCCRASTAAPAWSGRASRCRPMTCIARPAACRMRCARTWRASPRTSRILRPTTSASPSGASGLARLPAPRIAFAWSGSASHANDRNRSIALSRLTPWFAAGQGSFVSIQRDLREGDADLLARLPNVTHVGDVLDDFDDTAAVLALSDLLVSVDTSVVHLAGAMARPVLRAAAVPAGLALAARARRFALVSDRTAVPPAAARRLGQRHRAGGGGTDEDVEACSGGLPVPRGRGVG